MSGTSGVTPAALRRVEWFRGLDDATLESLAGEVRVVRVPAGAALIRQGDSGDSLYVVLHGRFVVELAGDDGTVRRVGDVSAGELVGEMAMLSSERRATTVRAARASETLELERAAFERVALRHPELFRRLASLLSTRLRNAMAPPQRRERLGTVAIVPHDASIALDAFVDRLCVALAPYREATPITSAFAFEHEGARGSSSEIANEPHASRASRAARASAFIVALERRAVDAVTAMERTGRLLLLVGDAADDEWNAAILEQADLVLVVGRAASPPAAGRAELAAPGSMIAPRELVLLHPTGTSPKGTVRWLTPGRFARHHHLLEDDAAHLARLARRLAGRSIGLALGGGGARGFAHIGVMRALNEAGVPIDRVGGTSMGSIMAAQVALAWDTDTMHARTREAFWHDPLAWDNTLPLVSKITCRKVVRLFQRLFGDACGEDAWLPWFCIDVSLTSASVRVRREGPLWQRVRASSALPGIGPPVIEGGEFLIDGAVINNLPADVLVDEGIGPVIAVNVSPREDLGTVWPNSYTLSGWRLLWERLRGSAAARVYPSALWVLQRTVLLGSVSSAERMESLVSLYLRPPVDNYEMFKWRAIDQVVEIGYRETRDAVREWAATEV